MSNPASTRFRGIAHVHSSYSFDGACDYPRLRETFVRAGLHFACMTEHIEDLRQQDIDAIRNACEAYSDSSFLFIPGIEMDCFTIYFLGVGPVQVNFSSERSIYTSLRNAARLCVLSHPIKANFAYPNWILADCDAVEIMNSKHDGAFYFRPQSERLLASVRRWRTEVVPIVGMDFHMPSQLTSVHMRLSREGPLTASFVLDELSAGRVEFFQGQQALTELGTWARTVRRARIRLMDLAHLVNRAMGQVGLRPPRRVRRFLSRFLEGSQ